MKKVFWGIAALLSATSLVSAHLNRTPFYPMGGESFKVGDTVVIKFSVQSSHDPAELAYSTDGNTWTTFQPNVGASVGDHTFKWKVPNIPSNTVRIRVCQKDGGAGCTNAENASSPGKSINVNGGVVYTMVSGNFTIQGTSGVGESASGPAAAEIAFLRFHPNTRGLEAVFGLAQDQDVSLQAFDAQGKLVMNLMEGRRNSGLHRVSIFSNRLQGSGPLLFQLRLGDRMITQSMGMLK